MVLNKLPKLRKSRFEKLVIHLSISDILFIVEVVTYIVLKELDTGLDILYKYACLSVRNITAGAYIFSLFQSYLICLELLNATFSVEINVIREFTSYKGVVIGCIVCHLGSIHQTVIEIFLFQTSLSVCNTSIKTALVKPVALLCICTILMYLIIVVRTYNRQNNRPGSSCNTVTAKMTIKAFKILSVVISITPIANIPSCIIALYLKFFGRTENIIRWIFHCNTLVIINPLLDPIIYVFRLEDFRDQIGKVLCRKHDAQSESRSGSTNATFDFSM
ncbi:OLFR [Mytilus coruscus]|uniref:OLFR n=1 Tax=Mytilus coruscus TaxID=42192 RepID=A0A6J8AVU8_MYTCO|nr:OLFR [Mytilus coruscus]